MVIRAIASNDKISLTYPDKIDPENLLLLTESARLEPKPNPEELSLPGFHNLLIQSDNLGALKLLCDSGMKGRVRLVYIDPPFATGRLFSGATIRKIPLTKHDFAYSDMLRGSEFIENLRRRLILLKELLSEDGSIYVHIDWKMAHYLRIVMDELFGPEHFVNEITRIKGNPKGMPRRGYGNYKDTILFYTKADEFVWNDSREEFSKEQIRKLFPRIDELGRRYTTVPLHASHEVRDGQTGQPWRGRMPPKGSHWQYPPAELDKLENQGLIVWSSTGNPRRKVYADDAIKRRQKRQDIWEFKDPIYPVYPTEKNLEMLKVIIEASSNRNDVVLDAFCGSGTTLVAAESLDRNWIGIDNSKLAIETSFRRLRDLKSAKPFSVYSDEEVLRNRRENQDEAMRSKRQPGDYEWLCSGSSVCLAREARQLRQFGGHCLGDCGRNPIPHPTCRPALRQRP